MVNGVTINYQATDLSTRKLKESLKFVVSEVGVVMIKAKIVAK